MAENDDPYIKQPAGLNGHQIMVATQVISDVTKSMALRDRSSDDIEKRAVELAKAMTAGMREINASGEEFDRQDL